VRQECKGSRDFDEESVSHNIPPLLFTHFLKCRAANSIVAMIVTIKLIDMTNVVVFTKKYKIIVNHSTILISSTLMYFPIIFYNHP